MNIPVVSAFLRKRRRMQIRRVMRGYNKLVATNRTGLFNEIRHELAHTNFKNINKGTSSFICGDATQQAELVVRQYLQVRVANLNFNQVLLSALSTPHSQVIYPMPREWRDVIQRHGFSVAHKRSAVLWTGYVAGLWMYGFLSMSKFLGQSIFGLFRPRHKNMRHAAYFDKLSLNNLPSATVRPSFDILSWYSQWKQKPERITVLTHSVAGADLSAQGTLPVERVSSPIPLLATMGQAIRFLFWGLSAAVLSGFDLLLGRWWNALMFHEGVKGYAMNLAPHQAIHSEFLFHNSGWVYRPLWTYVAERRGAGISLYFYSTNCELFKGKTGYPLQSGNWDLCNWPKYLVWDEGQASFLRRQIANPNIEVVGPIWFSGVGAVEPALKPSIAVFDVQPVRASFYSKLALPFEYYVPENAVPFVTQVAQICLNTGAQMLFKRKREIGELLHPVYKSMLQQLDTSKHITFVDPSVAAQSLIDASDIVISMPFTSTALIARAMAKPSCYYDPLSLLQKDDRAAHGIPIIQSREQLAAWVSYSLDKSGENASVEG